MLRRLTVTGGRGIHLRRGPPLAALLVDELGLRVQDRVHPQQASRPSVHQGRGWRVGHVPQRGKRHRHA